MSRRGVSQLTGTAHPGVIFQNTAPGVSPGHTKVENNLSEKEVHDEGAVRPSPYRQMWTFLDQVPVEV